LLKNADELAQGFYSLKLKHQSHLVGSQTETKASGSFGSEAKASDLPGYE
jgi:hypothetical protein